MRTLRPACAQRVEQRRSTRRRLCSAVSARRRTCKLGSALRSGKSRCLRSLLPFATATKNWTGKKTIGSRVGSSPSRLWCKLGVLAGITVGNAHLLFPGHGEKTWYHETVARCMTKTVLLTTLISPQAACYTSLIAHLHTSSLTRCFLFFSGGVDHKGNEVPRFRDSIHPRLLLLQLQPGRLKAGLVAGDLRFARVVARVSKGPSRVEGLWVDVCASLMAICSCLCRKNAPPKQGRLDHQVQELKLRFRSNAKTRCFLKKTYSLLQPLHCWPLKTDWFLALLFL